MRRLIECRKKKINFCGSAANGLNRLELIEQKGSTLTAGCFIGSVLEVRAYRTRDLHVYILMLIISAIWLRGGFYHQALSTNFKGDS